MENKRTFGILLVVLGVVYLLGQLMGSSHIFGFYFWRPLQLWPLTLLGLGLLFDYFHYAYKRNPGLLIPGGFFITLGSLHLFETLTMWRFAAYTWPFYILAIFIGFFHYYLVTKANWSLVVSIVFFSLFTMMAFLVFMIFFGTFVSFGTLMSVMLIATGLLLLTGRNLRLGRQS